MPPPHPHPHPHPGHGGHQSPAWFDNWGWSGPQYDTVLVESDQPPDWLWLAGGALAGIVLALLVRSK